MNAQNYLNVKSIFDNLFPEEQEFFEFKPINHEIKINSDEIKKKGSFQIYNFQQKKQILKNFILSKSQLYQCSDFPNEKIMSYLDIKNSRILKQEKTRITIYVYKQLIIFTFDNEESRDEWYYALSDFCIQNEFSRYYNIIKLIGTGKYSKVYQGMCKYNKQIVAIKQINKLCFIDNSRLVNAIANEIEVLRMTNHEGIIKLLGVFEEHTNIYLILEYFPEGDLFDFVKNEKYLTEDQAQDLIKEFFQALSYLHSLNIIHRDIKPENLLVYKKQKGYGIKIADFGMAMFLSSNKNNFFKCGSPGYIAPEILRGEVYDTKADVFSAGVVLYLILVGKNLFPGSNLAEIIQSNKKGDFDFGYPEWTKLSEEVQHLCISMLKINPKDRISIDEALKFKFFEISASDSNIVGISEENINSLKNEMDYDSAEFIDNSLLSDIKIQNRIRKVPIFEYKTMTSTKNLHTLFMFSNKNVREYEPENSILNLKHIKSPIMKYISDTKQNYPDLVSNSKEDYQKFKFNINKDSDESNSDIPDECISTKIVNANSTTTNSKKNSAKSVISFKTSIEKDGFYNEKKNKKN